MKENMESVMDFHMGAHRDGGDCAPPTETCGGAPWWRDGLEWLRMHAEMVWDAASPLHASGSVEGLRVCAALAAFLSAAASMLKGSMGMAVATLLAFMTLPSMYAFFRFALSKCVNKGHVWEKGLDSDVVMAFTDGGDGGDGNAHRSCTAESFHAEGMKSGYGWFIIVAVAMMALS